MGKLFAGILALAVAAPAWATASDAPQAGQIYLRDTQQVTARAHLIYKADTTQSAVEGNAVVVEHSQGLVMVSADSSGPGKAMKGVPASPVRTTTTATVSWAPAAEPGPSRTY
jgi:hypothetical protein